MSLQLNCIEKLISMARWRRGCMQVCILGLACLLLGSSFTQLHAQRDGKKHFWIDVPDEQDRRLLIGAGIKVSLENGKGKTLQPEEKYYQGQAIAFLPYRRGSQLRIAIEIAGHDPLVFMHTVERKNDSLLLDSLKVRQLLDDAKRSRVVEFSGHVSGGGNRKLKLYISPGYNRLSLDTVKVRKKNRRWATKLEDIRFEKLDSIRFVVLGKGLQGELQMPTEPLLQGEAAHIPEITVHPIPVTRYFGFQIGVGGGLGGYQSGNPNGMGQIEALVRFRRNLYLGPCWTPTSLRYNHFEDNRLETLLSRDTLLYQNPLGLKVKGYFRKKECGGKSDSLYFFYGAQLDFLTKGVGDRSPLHFGSGLILGAHWDFMKKTNDKGKKSNLSLELGFAIRYARWVVHRKLVNSDDSVSYWWDSKVPNYSVFAQLSLSYRIEWENLHLKLIKPLTFEQR